MAKSRKKTKGLIPKRIAGVKVPRKVRKGRFGELLASKTGQAVIAQAILGAGAVAAGLKAKNNPKMRRTARKARHEASEAARAAAHATAEAGSTLAYALGEAARTFAEALRGEPSSFARRDADETVWTPDYGAPDPGERDAPARKRTGAQQNPAR